MALTVANIHEFFNIYGWDYDFEENSNTWHTGFRGTTSNFSIFVHLTDSWLYFTISPFVNAPTDPACEKKLYYYLLRLNHAINMAKFSVDSDGDVVLTVELPTESLVYSEFADGLNALSFYADSHYLEILNVAQDSNYNPVFEDEEEAEPDESGSGGSDIGGPGDGNPPDWDPN